MDWKEKDKKEQTTVPLKTTKLHFGLRTDFSQGGTINTFLLQERIRLFSLVLLILPQIFFGGKEH